MPTPPPARNRAPPPATPAPKRAEERVGSSATYRSGPSCFVVAVLVSPEHHDEKSAEEKHGGRSGQTHDVGDDRAVTARLRIVVIAVQQHLVHHVADVAA